LVPLAGPVSQELPRQSLGLARLAQRGVLLPWAVGASTPSSLDTGSAQWDGDLCGWCKVGEDPCKPSCRGSGQWGVQRS